MTTFNNNNQSTSNNNITNDGQIDNELNGQLMTIASDTVGFTDDGNVLETGGHEEQFISVFRHVLPDTPNKTLVDIFSRFQLVGAYNFLSTGIRWPFHVKDLLRNHPAFHKLDGFSGFTGSLSLRIQWNSEPFMQGLYILAYVPPLAPVWDHSDAILNNLWHATYLSGCAHVIVNLAESTSATLTVPYVGPYTYVPLFQTEIPTLGDFYLAPIVPAQGAVSLSKLGYTAYFALTELQTYGSAPAVAETQSESKAKSGAYAKHIGSARKFIETAGEYIPESVVPKGVLKVADWALGGTQKVCDLMGWSKPFSYNSLTAITDLSYADTTTGDASFTGAKLAMNIDAGLGNVDLSGRGVDELQISEILSRPNLIPMGTNAGIGYPWSVADSEGSQLFDIDINPTGFEAPIGRSIVTTQLSYLARAFERWRGSMRFRLIPVCTSFHSGRLRLEYYPDDTRTMKPTWTSMSYTHVIDVRDPTTWEFEVPYISPQPWKQCVAGPAGRCGRLMIFIETPLVASSMAKDVIQLVPFVCGGKTFEFAVPDCSKMLQPILSQAEEARESRAETQAPENVREQVKSIVFAPEAESSSEAAHSMAVGDPVRSVRSVLKRFWAGSNPMWQGANGNVLSVAPVPCTTTNLYTYDRDMLSYLVPLFCFWRGGFRVYAQNHSPCRVSTEQYNYVPGGMTANCQKQSASVDLKRVNHLVPVGVTESVKVEMPYYYPTLCRNTFYPGGAASSSQVNIDYHLGFETAIVQRAAADDFDAGTLLGAPLLRN